MPMTPAVAASPPTAHAPSPNPALLSRQPHTHSLSFTPGQQSQPVPHAAPHSVTPSHRPASLSLCPLPTGLAVGPLPQIPQRRASLTLSPLTESSPASYSQPVLPVLPVLPPTSAEVATKTPPPPSLPTAAELRACHLACCALYDFTPLSVDDLAFKKGDTLIVLEKDGSWWYGANAAADKFGDFPANFVDLLDSPQLPSPARAATPELVPIRHAAKSFTTTNLEGTSAAGGRFRSMTLAVSDVPCNLRSPPQPAASACVSATSSGNGDGDGGGGRTRSHSLSGSDTAVIPPPPPSISAEDLQRYPFLEPDSAHNVRYGIKSDGSQELQGARLFKLIEKVTRPVQSTANAEFTQEFLLTYRSFSTPHDVLQLLKKRFSMPDNLFVPGIMEAIKIRVWYVLREWVHTHFYDFADDEELLGELTSFVETVICVSPVISVAKSGEQLSALIKAKVKGLTASMTKIAPLNAPKPIVPPVGVKLESVTDISSVEFARQITLMEFEVFTKIKPRECFNLAWSKKGCETNSPNVLHFINNFNKVGQWVIASILGSQNVKTRIKVLKTFLQIAKECKEICNFNSMMEIVAALSNASISRMKKTWTAQNLELMHEFEGLMDKNCKSLRAMMGTCGLPCLPYIGVFLQDLTFIEEGNANVVADTPDMINWSKMGMTAGVIKSIKQFQQKTFSFTPVPIVQSFVTGINAVQMTEKQAYELSLELEPRAAK
eukprot:TRINITY_DN2264_c0_g1_i2.p1 TRINITY_DN2264_c0_g1~~TRINITY_DN2264_c0_g1_i2.p1  ORF type:complete len:832 (+),score=192.46 TRINITY_DN2264_c0_g1_i2:341-2497(+)